MDSRRPMARIERQLVSLTHHEVWKALAKPADQTTPQNEQKGKD